MKSNVKVLYYVLKINGLAPFQLNAHRQIVEHTQSSFYYFVIFGAAFQLLSILAFRTLYVFLSELNNTNVRMVRTLVIKGELVVQLWKSFLIFFCNLLYRNDIINLINASILFQKTVGNTAHGPTLFDDILVSQYTGRLIAFLVQIAIIVSNFLLFIFDEFNIGVNLSWTVTIYNHFIALIVSSVFFYGGLVTSSRFLRILNNHLEFCVPTIRSEKNIAGASVTECATFHLDQFGIFFGRFSAIMNKLFHIYGFQILLTLTASSAFTLSSVRKFWVFTYRID